MKKIIVACYCIFLSNITFAQPATDASVEQLLEKIEATKIFEHTFDQVMTIFKEQRPEIPQEFWDTMKSELDTSALMQQVVQLYKKYFNQQDIDNLLAFYNSDTGKKYIAKQPQLISDSMKMGQKWGSELAQKVMVQMDVKYGAD